MALAYGFKWLWSPLVDRLPLRCSRWLGRRRSWMLFSQLLIAASLVGMAFCDPKTQLAQLASQFALLVAFASATQDIVIDAYRIESAPSGCRRPWRPPT